MECACMHTFSTTLTAINHEDKGFQECTTCESVIYESEFLTGFEILHVVFPVQVTVPDYDN